MDLSDLENDILTDLSQDSHELWEWYSFVRYNHPDYSEAQTILCGNQLLAVWARRGWLKVHQSRANNSLLSTDELLATVNKLGANASDPHLATLLLDLTDRAASDVAWLPKR